MLHKLLFCLLLALTISSCRGKIADNEMSNQDGSRVTSVDEEKPQEFKPIENEATAEALNKQNEALAASSEEVIEVSDKVYFDLKFKNFFLTEFVCFGICVFFYRKFPSPE